MYSFSNVDFFIGFRAIISLMRLFSILFVVMQVYFLTKLQIKRWREWPFPTFIWTHLRWNWTLSICPSSPARFPSHPCLDVYSPLVQRRYIPLPSLVSSSTTTIQPIAKCSDPHDLAFHAIRFQPCFLEFHVQLRQYSLHRIYALGDEHDVVRQTELGGCLPLMFTLDHKAVSLRWSARKTQGRVSERWPKPVLLWVTKSKLYRWYTQNPCLGVVECIAEAIGLEWILIPSCCCSFENLFVRLDVIISLEFSSWTTGICGRRGLSEDRSSDVLIQEASVIGILFPITQRVIRSLGDNFPNSSRPDVHISYIKFGLTTFAFLKLFLFSARDQ